MRLKKVKGALEIINASEFVIKDYENLNLEAIFKNTNPLHLEIGCGKGNFAINMALKYPDINFIAIEKFDSVLVRACQKEIPNNLRFILMDAEDLDKAFKNNVDNIYLNFSDPWPKKKHHKRRLTSPLYLAKYDALFKKDKNIIMKTDNRNLFEYSLISFNDHGYLIKEISLDLHSEEVPDNVLTEYEKNFIDKDLLIYKVHVSK